MIWTLRTRTTSSSIRRQWLADGNTVSLRGLLFSNGANPPVLVAKKSAQR